ncbi:nucleoside hydrolase [Lachnospiraceae bacterium 54-11]
MKREEILSRLGYHVPENKKVRVIVSSDVKNEADDQFAIIHHLLTPSFDVRGIIAAHFEGRYIQGKKENEKLPPEEREARNSSDFMKGEGTSMEQSFSELRKLMDICGIDDVPMLKGCTMPLKDTGDMPDSEGVDFLIREALQDDDRPLYVLLQGCLTDLASALNKRPEIGERLTAVWIGGGAYPDGGIEFNLMQDLEAARAVFASNAEVWQIPANVYNEVEISFADLALKVRPCGECGNYLFEQLLEMNEVLSQFDGIGRNGENWCLGDQPTVGVLLQNRDRRNYHMQKAPFIGDDFKYRPNPEGKEIRVYDSIDARLLLDDFYAKLRLCFGVSE